MSDACCLLFVVCSVMFVVRCVCPCLPIVVCCVLHGVCCLLLVVVCCVVGVVWWSLLLVLCCVWCLLLAVFACCLSFACLFVAF